MQANVYLLFQIDRLVASNAADVDVSMMQAATRRSLPKTPET